MTLPLTLTPIIVIITGLLQVAIRMAHNINSCSSSSNNPRIPPILRKKSPL
ncbi:Hypothetical protein FKW44_003448 [Caligus rogercresseyi]|uniref:Uncharacterized protein n=1 Tax=Caligus rogercresseyi TaxID=217165 RepID=A0A7T8QX16_CALRO|nr:Hypothetical protein FKW44_003448 [Caligus rogercresseyi]